MIDSLIVDKYYGAILGAVIGDALGWPYEDRSNILGGLKKEIKHRATFIKWIRNSGPRFYRHKEVILAGEYSDDSQLLFATARSLTKEDWLRAFLKQELTAWLLYQRGAGGATLRAAESWSKNIVPWKSELKHKYFEAGGNGVAMRILPHVFHSVSDYKDIAQNVIRNGICTHGHPRALLGAIIYAKSIHYLANKRNTLEFGELVTALLECETEWREFPRWPNYNEWFEQANMSLKEPYLKIWQDTAGEIKKGLHIIQAALNDGIFDNTNATLSRLNCFDSRISGAGTVAALVSIYITSKFASDPYTGLLEVLSLNNADTDTLASMVAGLFGTIHGSEWIRNEWKSVQDFKYIQDITRNLCNPNKELAITYPIWTDRESYEIKNEIKKLSIGDTLNIGPFGQLKIIEKTRLDSSINNLDVTSTKLESEEGQTIYIKSIVKVVPIKTSNIEAESRSVLSINQKAGLVISPEILKGLSSLLPARISAKKTMLILAEIITILQEKGTLTISEIDEVSNKMAQPGITFDHVKSILKFLNENLNFGS